ncbi:hypothetical protein U9M48_044194 [Paspalum notatum var. saurae]|uniref:Homeobox domain-containing protein n=1 Tax=Paspalum notatum var. saurae TaxID=547442 RepID=A0AAQ3UWI1_PASNO
MSSAAGGGYGAGGGGAEHQHQHLLLGQAAGQLYHVPQHSRREKLRFPPDPADSTPWPAAPPPFYSYASSSTSSYSPHSPTLAHAQLVAHALPAGAGAQIPSQNFALSLSSASSNPPPPTTRRQQLSAGVATGPYGPFTGYAAVLGRSRFLGPAQKLLEEICDVGGRPAQLDRRCSDEGLLDMDVDHDMDGGDRAAAEAGAVSGAEQQWRKTRLISLMEDVCRRYKQYYQQLQSVISSFETVAGLSNAAPFASMALRTMSKHFKCLKSMIMSQLRNTNKVAANDGIGKEDMANFALMGGGGLLRGNSLNAFSQPHNIWRPQRGLPERAVSVLRSWLFEHFLHPYPTDSDKQMLAKQTGLTRNQVSNWFINARVRLWKPMVEEIHNLEMRQLQKNTSLDKNQLGMQQQTQHSSDSSGKPSDPSSSQRGQSSGMTRNLSSPASRHIQGEISQMTHDMAGQVSFAYNGLPAHHGLALSHTQQAEGVSSGVGVGGAAANSGVSLTLGLHQNNRTYIAEPLPAALPLNLAHRFGLDDVSDAYVMGSFGGQDRHFAKEMGGHHLVHDFVG